MAGLQPERLQGEMGQMQLVATALAGAFDPIKIILSLTFMLSMLSRRWFPGGITAALLIFYVVFGASVSFGSYTRQWLHGQLLSIVFLLILWSVLISKFGHRLAIIFGAAAALASVIVIYVAASRSFAADHTRAIVFHNTENVLQTNHDDEEAVVSGFYMQGAAAYDTDQPTINWHARGGQWGYVPVIGQVIRTSAAISDAFTSGGNIAHDINAYLQRKATSGSADPTFDQLQFIYANAVPQEQHWRFMGTRNEPEAGMLLIEYQEYLKQRQLIAARGFN